MPAELVRQQLGDEVAVGGDGARQHAGPVGQRLGVHEVAVVPERELEPADVAVDGLRVPPGARARRRVARVPDGGVAGEARERAVVERVRHEAHVLHDGEGMAVAHRHARRLLPPVLQRVQPEVGEVSDVVTGRVDTEDPARFLGSLRGLEGSLRHVFMMACAAPVPTPADGASLMAPAW